MNNIINNIYSLDSTKGYFGPGDETTNGKPDIKEAFIWGAEIFGKDEETIYHNPNKIPKLLGTCTLQFNL